MARKLKVFCYSDGFHSWTVASSSRSKALEAWGVKRDLFKDGSAKEIDIGPDREAALASPGELIERGLAVDIGKVERTAAPKKAKRASDVKALEAELAALDEAQAEEKAALEAERQALDRRQAKARDELKAKLKAARAKLS